MTITNDFINWLATVSGFSITYWAIDKKGADNIFENPTITDCIAA